MPAPLDSFRLETLATLSEIRSFKGTWPHLQKEIRRSLGVAPTGEDVFRLGDGLSGIFLSVTASRAEAAKLESHLQGPSRAPAPVSSSRGQSEVSTAGVVWECLISWYLNFVCHGTDLMAARRTKENTPTVITDAISVTLHGYSTTSESDVVVFSVPGLEKVSGTLKINSLNEMIRSDTETCSVAIVQCKTNWNENAQIPMLWDLIYRSLPFVNVASIQLGRNGVTPRSFKDNSIKYAFMTVPTNKNATYKAGGVPVTRVLGLSGGNYWGKPTEQGVATGFSDFLNNNFSAHFQGSIQNHIDRQLATNPDLMQNFLDLDFR
jgi:hypothetical protein